VIGKDAPDDKLTVARARQQTLDGWQRPTKK
jgi:bifunctional UDP-N-acetylglucosamine pyrophosphorylase/glucosamine-1-phosphate N-acetyltransferase